MDNLFCQTCYNILRSNFINDQLTFKCKSCQRVYASKDNDTLIFEQKKETDVAVFEKISNNAANDPTNKKARIKCVNKKCDNNIVKQVRINKNLLINICTKCQKKWVY